MHQKTNRWRVPCLVALGALLPDSLRAQSASEAFPEPDSFADQLRGTESQDPTIGQRNHAISSCTLSGGNRTPPSTVCDLLPRPPPSLYSAEELAEFERRLANLAIFDAVHVQERNGQLQVVARERWTLIPIFEIATGGSLENTFVLFGLTEYNTLGSANETAIVASYERRGINFAASYSPHVFRSSAWTPAFTIFRESFEVGFAGNDPNAWRATDSGVDLTLRPPYAFDSPLRYEFGLFGFTERSEPNSGELWPADGVGAGIQVLPTLDRYRSNDFVPSGYRCGLRLRAGMFFGAERWRNGVQVKCLTAVPLRGLLGVAARVQAELRNAGNPNHNVYIGSREVHGLPDGIYWNSGSAVANLELRQGLRLGRWGLQLVLFTDGAAFQPMHSDGTRGEPQVALSSGTAFRVVPTFLSGVVASLDYGALWHPEVARFVQFSLGEHF
jgi:hypothetical protein